MCAPLSRFYFGDTSVPLLVSAVPLFISKLESSHSDEEISIAFPDEGACKRFGKMFAGFEVHLLLHTHADSGLTNAYVCVS
jgi:hypothetical protein